VWESEQNWDIIEIDTSHVGPSQVAVIPVIKRSGMLGLVTQELSNVFETIVLVMSSNGIVCGRHSY
jgi:hypothetical protein